MGSHDADTFARNQPETPAIMRTFYRLLVVAPVLLLSVHAHAQISFGGKVGANYAIGSQKIQPTLKDMPSTPKGLGMSFAAYMQVPFSDLVGIRPELGFSFRRLRSEIAVNTAFNNQQVTFTNNQGQQIPGTFTGDQDVRSETDQRLTYFQVNAPLMITPSEGLRLMAGPSFNFLMGGKQNTDVTATVKGTFTPQGQPGQTIDQEQFEATKKKGGAAIKNYRKADVMVMAGIGYTLPVGFDMDLRYYRSLGTTYDESVGTRRHRIWTNLVELSLGWTFGG